MAGEVADIARVALGVACASRVGADAAGAMATLIYAFCIAGTFWRRAGAFRVRVCNITNLIAGAEVAGGADTGVGAEPTHSAQRAIRIKRTRARLSLVVATTGGC